MHRSFTTPNSRSAFRPSVLQYIQHTKGEEEKTHCGLFDLESNAVDFIMIQLCNKEAEKLKMQ